MKITVVHGQSHQGNTYRLTALVVDALKELGGQVTEIRLPDQAPPDCTGCALCMYKGEDHCPHAAAVLPLMRAMDGADILILTSPNYVMNMTGQMKTLLDHLAHRWMSHRPSPTAFTKQGLVVSTAAGMGAAKVCRLMKTNLRFWGVPRTFSLSLNVRAADFAHIPPRRLARLKDRAQRLALRMALATYGTPPGPVTKGIFYAMRQMHKSGGGLPADRSHWEMLGWLGSERPWQ